MPYARVGIVVNLNRLLKREEEVRKWRMQLITIKRNIPFIDLVHVFLAEEYEPELSKKIS